MGEYTSTTPIMPFLHSLNKETLLIVIGSPPPHHYVTGLLQNSTTGISNRRTDSRKMSELGFVGFKDYRIERCIYGFVVRRLELYEKVQQPIIERCQQFSYQKNVPGEKRNF
jgi:hypothetical protein